MNDPQAINFGNARVRPVCDRVAGLYSSIVTLASEFQAKGLDQIIPDDDAVIIEDGAGQGSDGRSPMTGHDVHQIIGLATDLISMGSGQNTKMPTVLKLAVNPGIFS